MTIWRTGPWLATAGALLALSACGEDAADPAPRLTGTVAATPDVVPASGPDSDPPCDPGGGFPQQKAGCPDPEPETGWLTAGPDGVLTMRPFRTLGNDAEGKAYAQSHGLEYPYPNDYLDAPDGSAHGLELQPGTVCTGIILVGYESPLRDHVVDCGELVSAASPGDGGDHAEGPAIPVAVWLQGADVVQVSELYRP